MQLEIDGQEQTLMPLKLFRAQFNLPDEFGCAYFEKKDWPVGSLDSGAEALSGVRKNVIEAVPQSLTMADLLHQPEQVAAIFRANLEAVNAQIGLNEEQLDFAVDGLDNLLSAVVYELARLHQLFRGNPERVQAEFDFAALYGNWLQQSVLLFGKTHRYQLDQHHFEINIISYLYGRVGLRVKSADETYYVADPTLACPARGFMGDLAEAAALALCLAVTSPPDL